MALSKQEKESLNDYFSDCDLYDPSKAPEQEVTTFSPKMGAATGYADGGEVDFDGPVLSADTDTAKGLPLGAPPPMMELPEPPAPSMPPVAAPAPRAAAPIARAAGTGVMPAARPDAARLAPDEYDQLISSLSAKPSFGQSAMGALAGLADSIETGVAGAANPGFQKNLMESNQDQRKNLIEALRGKYESGLGARRATEEERHNKSAENIGSEEAKARLSESKAALQQNALEAMGRLSESGGITGRILGHPTEAQTAINALAERAGLTGGQPKIPTITTRAQYDALAKGTHYQDGAGKQGIKK